MNGRPDDYRIRVTLRLESGLFVVVVVVDVLFCFRRLGLIGMVVDDDIRDRKQTRLLMKETRRIESFKWIEGGKALSISSV